MIKTSSDGLMRRVGVLLGILALLLGYTTAVAPTAMADTPVITVTSLVRSNANGLVQTGRLTVGDVAKLSFNWSAPTNRPSDGDSFRIGLPAEFTFREAPQTRPLEVTHNGNVVSVGECQIAATEVVCTFNEKTDELQAQGFNTWSGTGEALLIAQAETAATSLTFRLNGEDVAVALPGGGGIGPRPAASYTRESMSKAATPLSATSRFVPWELRLNSTYLQQELVKIGKTLAVDGTTRSELVFEEELGAGQTFNKDLSTWSFGLRNSQAEPGRTTAAVLTRANGTDVTTTYGDWDIAVQFSGNAAVGEKATITIVGPWAEETNYRVSFTSNPVSASGTVVTGFKYTNVLKFENLEATAERYYSDSFTITVSYLAGFGGFRITKLSSGNGAVLIPAGTKYTVTGTYELPAQGNFTANSVSRSTIDTYPGWDPPGTPNADRTGGTFSFEVELGKVVTFQGQFPVGTLITLDEDPASATNAPDGYVYGTPVFEFSGSPVLGKGFQVADQTVTNVLLTNEATRVKSKFGITKTVIGGDFAEDAFRFAYSCDSGAEGELWVKGNGEVVESPELFVGDRCRPQEYYEGALRPGYSLTTILSDSSAVIAAGRVVTLSATNIYTPETGSFSVAKAVVGGDFAGDTFEIGYSCDNGSAGTLLVQGGGTAVNGPRLPVGTACDVTESDQTKQRDGYSVASLIEPGRVVIEKDEVIEVKVTNTYTKPSGSFQISKSVDGDASQLAPSEFTFRYVCVDLNDVQTVTGSVTVPAGGTAVSVSDVPVGNCTVTEIVPQVSGATVTTGSKAVGLAAGEEEVTFPVLDGDTVDVFVTNTYTVDRGTFEVSKTIAGDGAFAEKTFAFDYVCTSALEGEVRGRIEAKGDGVAVASGHQLPTGATCEVVEDEVSAQADGYTVKIESPKSVTISKDETTQVDFVNTYTKVATPAPTPTSSPSATVTVTEAAKLKPGLPKTGADGADFAGFAALVVVAGVVTALVIRRRK